MGTNDHCSLSALQKASGRGKHKSCLYEGLFEAPEAFIDGNVCQSPVGIGVDLGSVHSLSMRPVLATPTFLYLSDCML